MGKKGAVSGAALFESYYSGLYGERWPSLKAAFAGGSDYVRLEEPGCSEYFLDSASLLAASCLPLSDARAILDLCAAPGGKTLVLAKRMRHDAALKSNEYSKERYTRLCNTVRHCLPPETSARVTATCFDAATWCRFEKDAYDSVLLDAPCSSERHVWNDAKYLAAWTPARVRNLAAKQWSLLSSAFLTLKPGGFLLYSTCALSPAENDGVVAKLLKKYGAAAVVPVPLPSVFGEIRSVFPQVSELPEPEGTELGCIVLPDRNNGAGPLYFCLVQKRIDEPEQFL